MQRWTSVLHSQVHSLHCNFKGDLGKFGRLLKHLMDILRWESGGFSSVLSKAAALNKLDNYCSIEIQSQAPESAQGGKQNNDFDR